LDQLQRLVDHLLALTRLDRRQALPATGTDLSPWLYGLTDEVGLLFQASGLNFNVDMPTYLPKVAADPEAMRIVIRNLLDNAIQYNQPGGSVTLRAGASNGAVRIGVSDNGQGISPEDKARVFERFYRSDRSRSRRKGGAGLGLSLVRAITES
jgi:signal transduction histidine kinase